jgi:hypothetical protein
MKQNPKNKKVDVVVNENTTVVTTPSPVQGTPINTVTGHKIVTNLRVKYPHLPQ